MKAGAFFFKGFVGSVGCSAPFPSLGQPPARWRRGPARVILRGSTSGPNYSAEHVAATREKVPPGFGGLPGPRMRGEGPCEVGGRPPPCPRDTPHPDCTFFCAVDGGRYLRRSVLTDVAGADDAGGGALYMCGNVQPFQECSPTLHFECSFG